MRIPFPKLIGMFLISWISVWGIVPSTQAQGILYPRPEIRYQPFFVKDLRVSVVIHDAVAETSVQQTFVNVSNVAQEGTYLFPLPEGAAPSSFSMTIGDKTLEPHILSQDEARNTYESIVRRLRDPALLEYVGRDLLRVSVYPIPPQGERMVRLRYTEVLKQESGMRKYAYPLSTSRFGARPVGTTTVGIKLDTSSALKSIYSPTHDLSIHRPDEHTATASWETTNTSSDNDLTLYYSTSGGEVGMSLLTYQSGEEDGYFLLLASPRVSVPKERLVPKHVVFVLDRTGSMAGEKIKQARNALLFCLNSLHSEDRFDVITFNETPDVLTRKLVPATEAHIQEARRFVQDIEASGGTNIEDALRAALDLLRDESGEQKMVVFLTDGLPTVGETNINTILRHVQERNTVGTVALHGAESGKVALASSVSTENTGEQHTNARIFCFGLGYDVNVPFLDRLADIGHGDADYVKPEEDIEVKVSSFFAKVSSPVLSNLKLAFEGADVHDVYPRVLPDLFLGSQLIVSGRFRSNSSGSVRLTGSANGTAEAYAIPSNFVEANGRNAYIPRIWATRKIGYLADQIRLSEHPENNKEAIDEIVRLSREHGIITEYTSFLIQEDTQAQQRIGGVLPGRGGFPGSGFAGGMGGGQGNFNTFSIVGRRASQNGIQGPAATDQSLRAKALQNNAQALSRYQSAQGSTSYAGALGAAAVSPLASSSTPSGSLLQRPAASATQVTVQAVGNRTFYLQKSGVWQDVGYDAKKQKLIQIKAFSDAHFALLRAIPALAAYSSVGDNILVMLKDRAVQIGPTGKEQLTSAEIKEIASK